MILKSLWSQTRANSAFHCLSLSICNSIAEIYRNGSLCRPCLCSVIVIGVQHNLHNCRQLRSLQTLFQLYANFNLAPPIDNYLMLLHYIHYFFVFTPTTPSHNYLFPNIANFAVDGWGREVAATAPRWWRISASPPSSDGAWPSPQSRSDSTMVSFCCLSHTLIIRIYLEIL